MSYLTKILFSIVMNRIRNKIRPEVPQEQLGLLRGKGTTNAIYTLRTVNAVQCYANIIKQGHRKN